MSTQQNDTAAEWYAILSEMRRRIYKYVETNGGGIETTEHGQRITRTAAGDIAGMDAGKARSIESRLTELGRLLHCADTLTRQNAALTAQAKQAHDEGYRKGLAKAKLPEDAHTWRDPYRAADILRTRVVCTQTALQILEGNTPARIGTTIAGMDVLHRKGLMNAYEKELTRRLSIDNARKNFNF